MMLFEDIIMMNVGVIRDVGGGARRASKGVAKPRGSLLKTAPEVSSWFTPNSQLLG